MPPAGFEPTISAGEWPRPLGSAIALLTSCFKIKDFAFCYQSMYLICYHSHYTGQLFAFKVLTDWSLQCSGIAFILI